MEENAQKDREKELDLRSPMSDFPLSVRTINILRKWDVHTIGDLAVRTEEEVREWLVSKQKVFEELSKLLADLGLQFGMKILKIDIKEVASAMESERLMNEYFLDTETGDVVIIPEEIAWAASEEDIDPDEIPEWEKELLTIARAVESESSRYVFIPNVESYEIYELMQLFASGREDEELQRLLWVALDGKGAFGRFRRVLSEYPEERDEWYRMKDETMRIMAQEWLSTLDIQPPAEQTDEP